MFQNRMDSVHKRARYPLESSFFKHLGLTGLLIFVPAFAVSLLLGERVTARPFQMLFGHWVCPFILWFFAASLSYLLGKRRLLVVEARHTEILKEHVLPRTVDAGPSMVPTEIYRWMEERLQQLTRGAAGNNVLLLRLRGVLVHGLGPEDLGLAGDVERTLLESSFALPRYTAWAIPMWGLIGTVLGISAAVARFSDSMQNIQSAGGVTETLQTNLPLVTKGLASAFDATFLALLLSLPLMLLITWIQKHEENYLSMVEETWQQEILPRVAKVALPTMAPAAGGAETRAIASASAPTAPLSEDLGTLSLQVRALQETVADLHEGLSRAAHLRQG